MADWPAHNVGLGAPPRKGGYAPPEMAAPKKQREIAASLPVLHPNRALKALAIAAMIVGPLALVAFAAGLLPPGVLGVHAFLAGFALFRFVTRYNLRPVRKREALRVSAEGVRIGDVTVPRSAIHAGFYQPRVAARPGAPGSTLRLLDRRGRVLVEVEVESEDQAIEMLAALGLDAAQKRAEFRVANPVFATKWRQVALFGALFAGAAGLGASPALVGLALVPILVLALTPARIEVGVDGLLVRWLWRKRFVPMSAIRSVESEDDRAVKITLTSGEVVTVYTSLPRRGSGGPSAAHHASILARIEEAWRVYAERGTAVDASALVARGGRDPAAWTLALARLSVDGGNYREGVVRAEDLLRVVEDPRAPADARAGAALVLHKSGDADARARVRASAEAVASPRLRVALDAAGGDDLGAVERALDELAAEEEAAESAAAARMARR